MVDFNALISSVIGPRGKHLLIIDLHILAVS